MDTYVEVADLSIYNTAQNVILIGCQGVAIYEEDSLDLGETSDGVVEVGVVKDLRFFLCRGTLGYDEGVATFREGSASSNGRCTVRS
jgi:hypothetical protein